MDAALKIIDPVIALLWDHGIKQVTYIFRYEKHFEELNKEVKHLGEVKKGLHRLRDEAKSKGDIVEDRVEEWFGEVGEFESRVENYRNNAGHKKTRGFYYLLPYYRHKLGRKAKKMENEASLLRDASPKVDEVSYAKKVTSFDLTSSNLGYIEFDSRKSIVEDVMTKLKNPNMKIIGLHGPQGMGKSMLIKKIAIKTKEEGLFDKVAEIDVTINPNPLKIQEDIAYVLGLPLVGESENVRADCLRRWLKIENVSILIILDDLHERLDLNRLGIPVDDDYDLRKKNELSISSSKQGSKANPNGTQVTVGDTRGTDEKVLKKENFLSSYKGCRVLLSSRHKEVFPDEVDLESIFCLKELDENDSLMLFENEAGRGNKMSMPKEEIKNYCTGAPMTIIRCARRFKSWIESESEPTLDKFKLEWEKSMKITNETKHHFPKDEELKFIYLLCAQMGPLPLIMDLVKYCFGLGIFEGVSLLSEARHKINKSIQELQDLGYVSYKSPNTHFKMSHIIRGDALSDAHKDHNIFALRDGKLDDWPELEKCTSISICNSDIIDGLPQFINCPHLKFLQIDTSDPSLEIPESFFKRMENLKVLILTGFRLSSLPYSIECLSNLRMFSLERCTLDCNLSLVRKFKKLRILSFSGSQLETLPTELRYLDKLRLLDISDCFELKFIPPNLLSSLTCLEELYISKSLIKMLVETDTNKGQNSFLSELTNLHQLKVVDLSIPCVSSFPNQLIFDKLTYYKIEIGDFEMISVGEFWMPNKYEELKVLALQLKNDTNIRSKEGIKLLLKTVHSLLLGAVGVQNVVNDLNMDGFLNLKHLSIINNKDIEYVNSTKLSNCGNVFPNLEYICLYNLMNLKMICYGEVTVASFAKLKTIRVEMCYRLENLFSFYSIKNSTCAEETSEISDCNSYMNEFLASLEMIEVCKCESLKEILQIPMNYDKVEFLMLRTLTLQSLPSFTCFSTKVESSCGSNLTKALTTNRGHTEISTEEDDHSDKAPPLFGELVEVPNLENLNLSSLNIHKIWSNQHLSSVSFQNLINLVVKDCDKLTHLCSLPMASHLKKLKSLVISGCPIMEKIFETEGISAKNVYVFPRLEKIHLTKMNGLIDIWPTKVSADSFSNLISVSIQECNQLDKIFPSQMQGWFESLINLKVSECESVIEIFEINDSHEINAYGIDTNLQVILLESLPKLTQLWSKDPDGILNFKKLQSIDVCDCDELTNLFPTSVAKDVSKLERMSVFQCEKMVEIVASKDASEEIKDPLKFPELTYVRLYGLSNMKQFYEGRHPIKCPKLKELSIEKCVKLQTFLQEKSETRNEENFIFLAEEVFPNLEYMEIDLEEAQKLLPNYQMQCLKELIILGSVKSTDLLYPFMYRMPNLEKLKLTFPEYARESVTSSNIEPQELGTVLKLKQLFVCFSDIKDIGFERYQVLQRLELLRLKGCHELNTLAPSSVMLTYLTCLKLKNCEGLRYLMASSTANSMVQLKTMKVIKCPEVKEIVSNEGNEEGKVMKIVFSKLICIELVGLYNLASFCSYAECEFEFPSLEMFIVRECPKMEKFSEKMSIAPKLKNIFGVRGNEKSKWQWEGHLNATIQKVFTDKVSFAYTEFLWLNDNIIKQVWDDTRWGQQDNFGYLKSLSVWGCDTLKHIIPSHLLSCFHNLEELNVWNCSNAEVIFNMNDENRVMTKPSGIFRLKTLSLSFLAKLKHVWEKDPEGIIGPQLLKEMHVQYCKSLKSLFPASVAKDLTRLEVLNVIKCGELEEIFRKDGKDEKGEGTTHESVFPRLTSLRLQELPALKYSIHCSKQQESISNLRLREIQELCLGSRPIPNSCFRFLDSLIVDGCKFSSDVLLPFSLLSFLAKLETLEVRNCVSVKVIFDVKCTTQDTMTFPLKKLALSQLPDLKNVWNEDPHGILSMHHLQELHVEECKGLKSMFPASGAKEVLLPFNLLPLLPNLVRLEVRNCDDVEAIFDVKCTTQGRDVTSQPLPFSLKNLTLSKLPKLKTIWNKDPHRILNMRHPQQVHVEECKRLKSVFPVSVAKDLETLENLSVEDCEGLMTIVTEDNTDSRGTNGEVTFPCYCVRSLKSRGLPKLKYFYYYTHLELQTEKCMAVGENGMKMILRGELERKLLDSLKTLTLYFRSDVFRCKILEVVPNIEKLVVFDGSFKKMFCCESLNNVLKQLKVLRLEFLGELVSIGLENSWTESFVRNLETFEVIRCKSLKSLVGCTVSFSNLRCLKVEDCHSLSYLLTSSSAKRLGKLKRMEIKNCNSIEEIVYKEDGEESDEDEIIFQQLTYLNLYDLSKLKRFYRGSLGFPSLEELSVTECDKMITLCEGSIEAGKLSQVKLDMFSDAIQLETELNSTMRKKYLTKSASRWKESLEFRDRTDLQEIWRLSLQITFRYLKALIVNKCKISSDDAVLPFTLLSLLPKLETLEVQNCDSVKTIFDVKCTTQTSTTFPLKNLVLRKLPNLETVCNEVTEANPALSEGTNPNLTFSCLTSLTVLDLPNFNHNSIYCIDDDAAPTFELIIPNLEHLTVGKNELKMIVNGELQRNLLHKLKVLTLCFDIECDEFPEYGFLQELPNVMKLVVCDSSFKEIFCDQRPNNSEILLQLKELRLESLQELVSIGLENSWTEPFVRNLETFEVIKCSSLKNLVECRVSFSNLICLKVENCDSLSYLFISSTAKSLAKLQRMEIKECESIEEIVSKEVKESDEDEIIFPNLNCLSLIDMKNLRRFYKGSLSFPLLSQLSIAKCNDMVRLCGGTLEASKLSKVKLEWSNTTLETGLNSTMKKEFLKKISKHKELDLESRPGLQEIWNGSLHISDLCFSELTKLTVNNCQFLSDAVLPFHLLPSLPKLEILEVRNCNYVKVIFGVNPSRQDTLITLPLKRLILSNLPNVENVWNEDPRGILSMHHLEQVFVDKCKCLKSVFPASVARDLVKLEDLVVEDCEGLMAIVAHEYDENEEIIFERLQVLDLKRLKQLRCFCAGNFALSFPSLEEVHVIKCSSMKTFSGVTKIDNPTRWYYSEYARPRKETDLNSALHKTSEDEAPDASSTSNT